MWTTARKRAVRLANRIPAALAAVAAYGLVPASGVFLTLIILGECAGGGGTGCIM